MPYEIVENYSFNCKGKNLTDRFCEFPTVNSISYGEEYSKLQALSTN